MPDPNVVTEAVKTTTEPESDFSNLSDEELDKKIAEDAGTPAPTDDQSQPKPPAEEDKKPEGADKAEEQKPEVKAEEAPKPPDEPATIEDAKERLRSLNEGIQKLTKQLADKEAFIQRQAGEIGVLRKVKPVAPVQPGAVPATGQPTMPAMPTVEQARQALGITDEDFYKDPARTTERINQYTVQTYLQSLKTAHEQYRAREAMKATESENEFALAELDVQKTVYEHAPDFEDLKPTMAEMLKADGKYTDAEITSFLANPWKGADKNGVVRLVPPAILVNMALRAKMFKEAKEAREALKVISERRDPDTVSKNIDAAARAKTPITKAPGKSPVTGVVLDEKQFSTMKYEDIEATLAEAMKAEK